MKYILIRPDLKRAGNMEFNSFAEAVKYLDEQSKNMSELERAVFIDGHMIEPVKKVA